MIDDVIKRLLKAVPGDTLDEWKLRQETANALKASMGVALALLKSTKS